MQYYYKPLCSHNNWLISIFKHLNQELHCKVVQQTTVGSHNNCLILIFKNLNQELHCKVLQQTTIGSHNNCLILIFKNLNQELHCTVLQQTTRHEFHETCHSVTFYFMKKKTTNDAVTLQRQSQFTPKMKANAVPRLLSSLVWIDQYNECNGLTSFMEFIM